MKLSPHTLFRSRQDLTSRPRGLIRQHQFDKVDLVQVVVPRILCGAEALTNHAALVLERRELAYA